jgi:uncharacterized DUF497 family protein
VAVVWDPGKLESNIGKHGVGFAEAALVLEDPAAITVVDNESDPSEQRFVTLGADAAGEFWWWSTLGAATTSA